MRVLLALLAGKRVTKTYRMARGWQTAQDNGTYYLRGLLHGTVGTITVATVLLLMGDGL